VSKDQDLREVAANLHGPKRALDVAYNELGMEMQQRGLASKARIDAVKDALKALDAALPKETRKLIAEAEHSNDG
jgi:heme oxygenase